MKRKRFLKNEFNLSRNNVLILQMSTFGFQFTKMMSVQLVKWSTPPSAPRPLEEARLPRVCVQKLTELRMTRQEQKWLVRPSILPALLLYQMWRCGGFEFANQYSTPHVHSLYRTKCHFKSWWFVQSSCSFCKKKVSKTLSLNIYVYIVIQVAFLKLVLTAQNVCKCSS